MCVCVCVCERETERDREREKRGWVCVREREIGNEILRTLLEMTLKFFFFDDSPLKSFYLKLDLIKGEWRSQNILNSLFIIFKARFITSLNFFLLFGKVKSYPGR